MIPPPMPARQEFTVTPYTVEGDPDYERLLEQFGADELTADQIAQFPEPVYPLVRREIFYAERDVDSFLAAANAGECRYLQLSPSPESTDGRFAQDDARTGIGRTLPGATPGCCSRYRNALLALGHRCRRDCTPVCLL
jgi:hypothetical protein